MVTARGRDRRWCQACRCAGPTVPSSRSVVICQSSPLAAPGTAPAIPRVSPSRSKLPSGRPPSRGPFQRVCSSDACDSRGSSAQITGIAAASHSHGPSPAGGSPSRKRGRAPSPAQISAATAFASCGWPLRTTSAEAARFDSARARRAAASRRLGGSGGASDMPSRRPGRRAPAGRRAPGRSAADRSDALGHRSGFVVGLQQSLERAAPAGALRAAPDRRRWARLATSPARGGLAHGVCNRRARARPSDRFPRAAHGDPSVSAQVNPSVAARATSRDLAPGICSQAANAGEVVERRSHRRGARHTLRFRGGVGRGT